MKKEEGILTETCEEGRRRGGLGIRNQSSIWQCHDKLVAAQISISPPHHAPTTTTFFLSFVRFCCFALYRPIYLQPIQSSRLNKSILSLKPACIFCTHPKKNKKKKSPRPQASPVPHPPHITSVSHQSARTRTSYVTLVNYWTKKKKDKNSGTVRLGRLNKYVLRKVTHLLTYRKKKMQRENTNATYTQRIMYKSIILQILVFSIRLS